MADETISSRGHHLRWLFAVLSGVSIAAAFASLAYGELVMSAFWLLMAGLVIAEFVVPRVTLRADTVHFRKVFRSRSVELRLIENAVVYPFAAYFTLTDGSRVSSSALQTGLIYRCLRVESGPDRFAREITERARALRDDDPLT